MSFWTMLLVGGTYFFHALVDWLYVFISPIKNLNILWIILPIWGSWFFAEFFQEKKGTSFGNAITNGVVPLFVGLDWTRYTTNLILKEHLPFSFAIFTKYLICLFAMIYGFLIIYYGIKGKIWVKKYLGRVREVTYVFVFYSPVIYDIIPLSFRYIVISIIFFPLFYYIIEFIDLFTPDAKVLQEDMGATERKDDFGSSSSSDQFSSSNGSDPFASSNNSYGNNNSNQRNNNNDPFANNDFKF
jgi:hypothetical protein